MAVNVEVERGANETSASVVRRFTRRTQAAGILNRVRKLRYHTRNQSKYKQKVRALKVLERRAEVDKLIKLGKMVDKRR
jgi:hypothetical protein